MSEKNFVKSETSRDALHELPTGCGVYILSNQQNQIIYIGKAIHIQKRVRNHIQRESSSPLKRDMAREIATIAFIQTQDESEALLLEEELIKTYQPHYNIRMKDDKSYPYIHFDSGGDFPSVKLSRRKIAKQGYFYGPYTNTKKAREGLKILRQIFLLRGCSIPESRFPLERPCLDYELKLCCAPCVGKCTSEEYHNQVLKARSFLEGDYQDVINWLESEMWQAADQMDYEKAAQFRNHLSSLRKIISRYRLVLPDGSDVDFIDSAFEDNLTSLVVARVRKGRLIGVEHFNAQRNENADREYLLAEFIENFYLDHFNQPEKICVHFHPLWYLQKVLQEKGCQSQIYQPQSIPEQEILQFTYENAQKNVQLEKMKTIRKNMDRQRTMNELKILLSLPILPRLVEGLDISTFQGDESVGAIVSFFDCSPQKKKYRKYIIRSIDHPDDFKMIEETLFRHLQRKVHNNDDLPDLLVIDGGIGQLNAAMHVLHRLSLDFPILSLAKENEDIYLPGQSKPLRLPHDTAALQFLQRVRNEVHRFVISFHRLRRNKKMFHSFLDEIPGIGPQRKRRLLSAFDDIKEILHAQPEELSRQLEIPLKVMIELQKRLQFQLKAEIGEAANLNES